MRSIRFVLAIATLFLSTSLLYSQTTTCGGRGMLRVFSARTVQPSSFHINGYFLTFLIDDLPVGLSKDHTVNLGLTYGLSRHLELTAQIVAYQDDQRHVWGPPGDTQLGLKLHLPLSTSTFGTGLRGYVIFPTAKNHDVPYEPFSSGEIAWGVTGLLTLDMTHTFPLFPLKIYANVGYLDHDVSTLFGDEITDQLILGFGFKFPISSLIFYTEYTGEIFFNAPHVDFMNNSMRVTQGVKFVGPFNLVLDFAFDVGLSEDLNAFPVKKYADWKVIAGINYQFVQGGRYDRDGRLSEDERRRQDADLIEQIKKRRENVDEELEKMREKLKGDSKEKP